MEQSLTRKAAQKARRIAWILLFAAIATLFGGVMLSTYLATHQGLIVACTHCAAVALIVAGGICGIRGSSEQFQ